MKKSVLAVALMLGLMGGAGVVGAAEQGGLVAMDHPVGVQTVKSDVLVVALLDEQDGSSIVDEGSVVDKKKAKKSKKKVKSKKKKLKQKKAAPGATEDGAGAGPTGQWDSGAPQ